MNNIFLKKHKEESILRFHPWVFSGAIARIEGKPTDGELVCVRDYNGNSLGVGHYQDSSIAVRILDFGTDHLNTDFFAVRIKHAWNLRQSLCLSRADNDTFRLLHGEGDFLPGLIVDIYNDTAVMQAHSAGMHLVRNQIANTIAEIVPQVKNVYYKSESTLPLTKNFSDIKDEYLIGSAGSCLAKENGLVFSIDWLHGQKTGFFVDQRENRSLLEKYSYNRNVLNMFCYTGGFSVYALRGGAKLVHSVDSSEKAIELVNANVSRNFNDDNRHTAFVDDAFHFLSEAQEYDLIILDPPAFAKHRAAINNALQGYKRLNYKAIEKIKHNGLLFTFSCSQTVSKEAFRLAVFSAAAMAKRRVRILHQLSQPQDHPINIYHPESEYLKGLVLYVE